MVDRSRLYEHPLLRPAEAAEQLGVTTFNLKHYYPHLHGLVLANGTHRLSAPYVAAAIETRRTSKYWQLLSSLRILARSELAIEAINTVETMFDAQIVGATTTRNDLSSSRISVIRPNDVADILNLTRASITDYAKSGMLDMRQRSIRESYVTQASLVASISWLRPEDAPFDHVHNLGEL